MCCSNVKQLTRGGENADEEIREIIIEGGGSVKKYQKSINVASIGTTHVH